MTEKRHAHFAAKPQKDQFEPSFLGNGTKYAIRRAEEQHAKTAAVGRAVLNFKKALFVAFQKYPPTHLEDFDRNIESRYDEPNRR